MAPKTFVAVLALLIAISGEAFAIAAASAPHGPAAISSNNIPASPALVGMAHITQPVSVVETEEGKDFAVVYNYNKIRLLTISIKDAEGKLLRFLQISGSRYRGKVPLDMESYPPGEYEVHIDVEGDRQIFPITKK